MPRPLYTSSPSRPPLDDRVESPETTFRRSQQVELSAGCRLLSHGCKVTSSNPSVYGELELVTDGDRSGAEGSDVELPPGKQWVQLDLGDAYELHCIWMWHFHRRETVCEGVEVEIAESESGPWYKFHTTRPDPCCPAPHPKYEEMHTGFPIILKGPKARYVRLWSEGCDHRPGNHYVEVSVYGRNPATGPLDYFRPAGAGKVKLEPELPRPIFLAPPSPPPDWKGWHVENDGRKRKDNVFIGEGCQLLSLHCPVTTSDPGALGEPSLITDGKRLSENGEMLEMDHSRQWVVIDLGARREIHCIWMWLNNRVGWLAFHNVILQVTDDPAHAGSPGGTIVFNNDDDGSEGFGKGTDFEWVESSMGRPITFPPVRGRYVKVWMNGSTLDGLNAITEVAVYGKEYVVETRPNANQGDRPASPDSMTLVRKIREHIVKTSTETETAQMKPYTGKVPRSSDAPYDMVPIPAGEFLLGSPETEKGRRADEGPQVKVKISPFWMGAREVTWDEIMPFVVTPQPRYKDGAVRGDVGGATIIDAVSGPTSPYTDVTWGKGEKGYPVICLTEHTALKYCQWLSAQTGHFYRLPTEAEWEYAARAGTTTAWFFGDSPEGLTDYAWFDANSEEENVTTTHPVGQKKPNPWGLYDIYGNVAEFTLDEYSSSWYTRLAALPERNDPFHKPVLRYPRVVRGGSYDDMAKECRSSHRRSSSPNWKQMDPQLPKSLWYHTNADFVGFRIVRPLKVPPAEEMYEIWNLGAVGEDK